MRKQKRRDSLGWKRSTRRLLVLALTLLVLPGSGVHGEDYFKKRPDLHPLGKRWRITLYHGESGHRDFTGYRVRRHLGWVEFLDARDHRRTSVYGTMVIKQIDGDQ